MTLKHSRGWKDRPYDEIYVKIGPIRMWIPTPTLPIPHIELRK